MSGRPHRSLCGLGVALVLLTSGCASMPAHGPVALAPLPSATPTSVSTSISTSWDEELRGATRRVEAYDWAMRQADLRATLITPRLRQAFAREQARFHGRFARDAAKELLAMGVVDEGVDATAIARPGNEEQVLVVAALYVAEQRHRDLAMKGSIWDVALVVDGVRVKPLAHWCRAAEPPRLGVASGDRERPRDLRRQLVSRWGAPLSHVQPVPEPTVACPHRLGLTPSSESCDELLSQMRFGSDTALVRAP
jgi:hypothetical protein